MTLSHPFKAVGTQLVSTPFGGRRYTRMRGQTCIYYRTGFNRDAAMSGEDRAIGEPVYVGGHTCGRHPASEQPE